MYGFGPTVVGSITTFLCKDNNCTNEVQTANQVINQVASTGRTEAQSLAEQLAMEATKADPLAGKILENVKMNDPRWPASEGWVKMQQVINGIVIHYVRNIITGQVMDFKFK